MKIIEITQHILPNTEEGRKLADDMEHDYRRINTYRSRYETSHQITIESKFVFDSDSGTISGKENDEG